MDDWTWVDPDLILAIEFKSIRTFHAAGRDEVGRPEYPPTIRRRQHPAG
jgi:hypothetical protein